MFYKYQLLLILCLSWTYYASSPKRKFELIDKESVNEDSNKLAPKEIRLTLPTGGQLEKDLFTAIKKGCWSEATDLVRYKGADVNAKDSDGETVLNYAVKTKEWGKIWESFAGLRCKH